MAWIESHQTLREHPKVYELMDLLQISVAEAVGHLHLLWWWCVDYAPTGQIKSSDTAIARAAVWSGEAKVFVEALIKARFLDRKDGVLTVHDWLDFCGDLIKKRLEYQEVKRSRAQTLSIEMQTKTEDSQTFSDNSQRKDPIQGPTVPYSTVPNQTEHKRWRASAFSPPTFEEVQNYISLEKYPVDPQKWFDFYQSKGWMVGRNRMKDWKAAVRTWIKRDDFKSQGRYQNNHSSPLEKAFDAVDRMFSEENSK